MSGPLALRALLALTLLSATACATAAPLPPPPKTSFTPEIAHFAELDQAAPPKPCGFLFTGSSSVRFWKTLDQDMAPYRVINRGFGGSQIADVTLYFDQVVRPYRPRAIFFYAGENDINAGKAPVQVVADFQRFMDMKDQRLGKTKVYFIALKPSKLRWGQLAQQAQVNARIKALADKRTDLDYVDVVPAMLDGGQPRDIYVADGLHMTPAGYELWTQVVRPVVEQEAKTGAACKG
ncbi:GDSL-type esterase/lipase family protein [Phenylobacterium sp.]|uniref:GDSL-type esterase/lipase family protein n=1 Tax=Phenylobacterium sp. TaxID=1871053 RepID=UPI00272764FE|nr:GDSL-type esterase/lipase family protein [Phenylobacterium sp.]MDO8379580.1 GDSL-type esterase/lipase family protein [Phenylobacterium sp.]